ncbi:MAG: ATP-binding cassette domain-containing protein [Gemmataceae bacterium]|nr:ATP-binding cassette domain-containing protein [Gemmataceae bacterium]
MELIRVHNLFKTYHLGEVDVPVLRGVSLSIRQGEMVALMGASGSGKTTLMNILGCLDHPSSGEYWFDGQEMSRLRPNERALVRTQKLGFVFQNFNLLPRTSALSNVLMPLDYAPQRPSLDQARQRAVHLLSRVGLSDRMEHEPSQMSGGQQQRVAIARALVNNPTLVLADEPTGNLDSHTSVEILRMFQQLNESGITVLLVTHDADVAAFAHRTIRIVDGLIAGDEVTPRGAALGPGISDGAGGTAEVMRPRGSEFRSPTTSARQDGDQDMLLTPAWTPLAPAEEQGAGAAAQPGSAPRSPGVAAGGSALSVLMPATLRTAVGALRRNKLRSALTSLGIIIGIAAVIAIVETGQGSRAAIKKSVASMGANTIIVQSGVAATGGVTFGAGSVLSLTPEDAVQIRRQCLSVAAVSPVVDVRTQVVYGNRNCVPMNIYGATPEYLAVRDWQELSAGDPFTDSDVANANRVCLIGETIVKRLFPDESPLGNDIRIRNVALRVIGVLTPKGASMMGRDQDDVVLAPWSTIKYRVAGKSAGSVNQSAETASAGSTSDQVNTLSNLYPPATPLYSKRSAAQLANTPQPIRFISVDQIMVKAVSTEEIPDATHEITALLRQRHRLRADEPDDFNLRDMAEITRFMSTTSATMTGMLLIVALISLVVGGVGIMNIMLVSVTERTREIGLRMAVGARSYHVLRQFLIEAVMLCVFGGILGVLLGRLAAQVVNYFTTWPMEMSIPAIVAAFVVSVSIGIVFGFYPAWKASRLDPIEAMRYE